MRRRQQVGGIGTAPGGNINYLTGHAIFFEATQGIAPGGNINYLSGHAIFEATHGTAPKYANQDMVNPGSVVLSGEMMLRYLGWAEAADLFLSKASTAPSARRKSPTTSPARWMARPKSKCSEFGDNIIAHIGS